MVKIFRQGQFFAVLLIFLIKNSEAIIQIKIVERFEI